MAGAYNTSGRNFEPSYDPGHRQLLALHPLWV